MDIRSALILAGPSRCETCRAPGSLLCRACRAGLPAPASAAPVPAIDRVIVPWAYSGPPRALILALKLSGRRAAADPLINGMVAEALRRGIESGVVCWVPGRERDRRARGFDHAEILARGAAAALGLPAMALLHRIGNPADQAGLSARARRSNLTGVFDAWPVRGARRVALVDDLITTGTTLTECGLALRRAGASRIEAICPCRA